MQSTCASSRPEGLEGDGHSGAPLTEVRAAEGRQARRGGEVLARRLEVRVVEDPRLVPHPAAPEQRPGGPRIEEIALDEELLQRSGRRRSPLRSDGPARLEVAGAGMAIAAVPAPIAIDPRVKIGKPHR